MSDQGERETMPFHNGLRFERIDGDKVRVVHARPSDSGEVVLGAWELDRDQVELLESWLTVTKKGSIPPAPPLPKGMMRRAEESL